MQSLKDILNDNKTITYGIVQPGEYDEKGIYMIRSQDYSNGWNDLNSFHKVSPKVDKPYLRSRVNTGDILITVVGANVGKLAIVPKVLNESNISRSVARISVNNQKCHPKYLFFLLELRVKKLAFLNRVGGAQPVLNLKDLNNFSFNFPSLPEQQKIASFLSSVDEKISQLEKKKTLLETYKRGIMQKIFSQELRFKDDNGGDFSNWDRSQFGEIVERIKKRNNGVSRNVLTISAQYGLINQEEYFNKSVASSNSDNYYLLKKGDFAYNKSYSKGYPLGAIKRLTSYEEGIVSPLYICFRSRRNIHNDFLSLYFDSQKINAQLYKIVQEGARNHGLLNMSIDDFFNSIYLVIPTLQEQQKIASFLSSIDKKIEITSTQLEKTREFKKGLLQQMFV